jgi:chorismate mutase
MTIRGIRGAITVQADETGLIIAATQELLGEILRANPKLQLADMASVFFTMTEDLVKVYPAVGARQMGWNNIPMMCTQEIPVEGSLPLCIRVLILWNTDLSQNDIQHIYLRDAVSLRPDLANSITK